MSAFWKKTSDNELIRSLYERYSEKIIRHIIRKVGNTFDAEDCASDTWLRAIDYLDMFKRYPEDAHLKLLYRISNTVVINNQKRKSIRETVELPDYLSGKDVNHSVELNKETEVEPDAELIIVMKEAINKLDDETREMVLMRYVDGMKSSDIARMFGINASTLRNHMQKALKFLRRIIEEKHE